MIPTHFTTLTYTPCKESDLLPERLTCASHPQAATPGQKPDCGGGSFGVRGLTLKIKFAPPAIPLPIAVSTQPCRKDTKFPQISLFVMSQNARLAEPL